MEADANGSRPTYTVRGRQVKSTRGTHTPEQRAMSIIVAMSAHFERLFPADQMEARFESVVLGPLWSGELGSGDDLWLGSWLSDHPEAAQMRQLYSEQQWGVFVGTAYALDAIRADRAKDVSLAWDFAFDAARWDGFLLGSEGKEAPEPADDAEHAGGGTVETRTLWRSAIFDNIGAIDRDAGGKASAEAAMRWLANRDPANFENLTGDRTLRHRLPGGEWDRNPVKKKSVQNCLAQARAAAVIRKPDGG